MSSEKDILRAINLFKKKNYKNFVVMHCVADYPHQAKDSQLGYIYKLNKMNVELGFSDHTLTSSSAAVAVSMGVKWVEKHFTLSSNLGGLDAKHSLDPDQLKEYVNEIRGIEKSLSVMKRQITANEKYTRKRARRGLYFKNNILKNKKIERNDLLSVRPENKFDIWNINKVVGKKNKKYSKKNNAVEIKDFY